MLLRSNCHVWATMLAAVGNSRCPAQRLKKRSCVPRRITGHDTSQQKSYSMKSIPCLPIACMNARV